MSMFDENDAQASDPSPQPIVRRQVRTSMVPVGESESMLAAAGRSLSPPWKRLGRYKWSILLVAILVAGPAITAVWMLTVPMYKAAGQIRVRPIIQRLVFQTDENGAIPFYQNYMNTQVAVVYNPEVLRRVLDQPDVQKTTWYNAKSTFFTRTNPSKLDRLSKALYVLPRPRTELIDVSFESGNPFDSAVIVNAVLNQYINHVNQSSDDNSNRIFRELVTQYNAKKAEIDILEDIVSDLRKELGTTDPAELLARRRVRLDETDAEMRTLSRAIATAVWRQKSLKTRLSAPAEPTASQAANDGLVNPRYEEDPVYDQLLTAVRAAKHEVKVQGQRLGDAHPTMVALVEQVKFSEENLEARKKQLDDIWQRGSSTPMGPGESFAGLARELEATNNEIERMQYAAKLLEDDADKQRKIMGRDMEKAEILNQRLREIDRQRELYEAVRRQVDQKSMERNVPGSIEIVKAMAPSRPSADRRVILSVMALFLGLAGGAGVAMLRAGASKAIFVAEELSCSATVPFLGQLPQVTSTPNHLPLDDPMLAEGIRMVRTSLLERLGRERAHDNVVLITSAGPGDGKTTVSVILARSLAQCGKRVLLVDADLRKPNIAAHLGLDSQIGLMEALTQGIDDSQVVVKTQTPRLSVLTAGHVCDGFDPELLVNGSFAIALERWREDYDVIIMDSPPVLAVADAQILASRADGTILIVRAEKTQRSEVAEAVYRLDASGGTLWGTIFIAPPRRRHSYAYGYGYGYGANS